MSPTVSLWTVLLSGVMSGVVAAYVTYRLNQRKENIFFLRQKAEALFINSQRWMLFLATHFFSYYPLFKNEASYAAVEEHALAHAKEQSTEIGDASRQTAMLTSIYFPALLRELNAVRAAREKLNTLIFSRKRADMRDDIDLNQFGDFHAATAALNDANKAFENALIDAARKIGEAPPWINRCQTLVGNAYRRVRGGS